MVRSDPVGSGRNPTYGGPKTSGRIRSDPVGCGRIRSGPVGIGACKGLDTFHITMAEADAVLVFRKAWAQGSM